MISQSTGKRRMRRRAATLATVISLLAAALVFSTGGNAARSSSSASSPTTLTWGLQSTIASLNWIKGWTLNIPPALGLAMQGMLKLSPTGQLEPNIASSWKQIDPTLYRYYLRHDVKFWDGHGLTAQDVVATYGYLADVSTGSPLNSMFAPVKYIRARDKYVVDIRLKAPSLAFKYQPAQPAGWITEKSFLEAHYSDMGTPSALLMGTGPYKITSFVPDQSVTFAANPYYWGSDKARYKQVVLQEIPDPTTRAIAVQSGQIDGALGVVPGTESQWQSNGVTTKFGADNFIDLVAFNMTAAPWSDIHVRRMVMDAIDRPALMKSVLGGNVTPANWFATDPATDWSGLLPPAQLQKAYATFPSLTFNMTKAKAELAASSVPNGFSATVYYPDNHPENGALALALAQNLKPLGVNLTVQKITYPAWVARAFGHTGLGMEFVYAGFGLFDPSGPTNSFLNSANGHANALNLANYNNPSVDANLAIANDATKSDAVRAAAELKVLKSVSTDLPYIPLWYGKVGIALRKNVSFTTALNPQSFYMYPWANSVTKK